MKPITLHPASVLAGLVLVGALFVLAAAAQSHGTVQSIPSRDVRLVGEIPASWWTYVELRTAPDGTIIQSFTVPTDRYLVVTQYRGAPVIADSQDVSALLQGVFTYDGPRNGTRVVLSPGAVLTLQYNGAWGGTGNLWGYLEPVR